MLHFTVQRGCRFARFWWTPSSRAGRVAEMIQADTRELETKLKQTVLNIRQKEVSLFTDQFAVLASSATFMSSLGFGALNMEIGFLEKEGGQYCSELVGCDGPYEKILSPLTLFYGCAAAGTACNLLAVILASFCMIFGPELAIRGTEGSMHHAVRGMYEERRIALRYFWVGCLFIVLSGIALGWMKFPHLTAGLITFVFVTLVAFCAVYVRRLAPQFAYEDVNSANLVEAMQPAAGPSPPPAVAGALGPPERRGTLEARPEARGPLGRLRGAAAASYGASYGATSDTRPPASAPGGDASRSGALFVDGALRYAVLDGAPETKAGGTLRLFSLDGKPLATCSLGSVAAGAGKFTVAAPDGVKVCAGTSAKDTAAWLASLRAAGVPPADGGGDPFR